MGNCLLRLNRPEQAGDRFRGVLAVNAESHFAHHNLGVSCFMLGRHEKGLEHFLRAVEFRPDFAMAMHKAALACIRLGRWQQAREMIRRALEAAPESEAVIQLSQRLWRFRLRRWLRGLVRPITWLWRPRA
jgi:tetratricopeptide (TPR) repeat protein